MFFRALGSNSDYPRFIGIILEMIGFILLLTQIQSWFTKKSNRYELVSVDIVNMPDPPLDNKKSINKIALIEYTGGKTTENVVKTFGILLVIFGLFFQLMSMWKIVG